MVEDETRNRTRLLASTAVVALIALTSACHRPDTPAGSSADPAPEADAQSAKDVPDLESVPRPIKWPAERPARIAAAEVGAGGSRPNVFLIVVDTLRLDSVGAYNGDKSAMPFVSRLAAQGIFFERAYATSSWTVPSMYSLITGLYPREHGVDQGSISHNGVVGQPALSVSAETLAERLRAAGYTTFGICTNHHLHRRFGFGQGFDHFVGQGFLKLPFPELAVDAFAEKIASAEPAFLWLHYFDPHFPYRANEPWFSRLNKSGYADWSALSLDAVGRLYRREAAIGPDVPIPAAHVLLVHRRAGRMSFDHPKELLRGGRLGGKQIERRYVRFFQSAYRSEVELVDRSIEQVFGDLGVGRDDLVIVVSDHGEEFLEHGAIGHRWLRSLHEELVRVPLLVLLPGRERAGTVVDAPVSLVDVLPTVLEVVGIDPADGTHSGRSLLGSGDSGELPRRPLHGELREPAADLRYRIDYPWKYIHDLTRRRGALYNLADDPTEQRNLIGSKAELAAEMKAALETWIERTGRRWTDVEPVPFSAQELEQLRAMGYVM